MRGKARGAQGSIYPYETAAGTRWRVTYRDSAGKQTTKRGFTSRAAARRERERLMGKVHRGEVRVSRESLAAYWLRYLKQRKPYLEDGSWQDYRRHGELRILPHLGHRKLTALTAPELREWLVELSETGARKPSRVRRSGGTPERPTEEALLHGRPKRKRDEGRPVRLERIPLDAHMGLQHTACELRA